MRFICALFGFLILSGFVGISDAQLTTTHTPTDIPAEYLGENKWFYRGFDYNLIENFGTNTITTTETPPRILDHVDRDGKKHYVDYIRTVTNNNLHYRTFDLSYNFDFNSCNMHIHEGSEIPTNTDGDVALSHVPNESVNGTDVWYNLPLNGTYCAATERFEKSTGIQTISILQTTVDATGNLTLHSFNTEYNIQPTGLIKWTYFVGNHNPEKTNHKYGVTMRCNGHLCPTASISGLQIPIGSTVYKNDIGNQTLEFENFLFDAQNHIHDYLWAIKHPMPNTLHLDFNDAKGPTFPGDILVIDPLIKSTSTTTFDTMYNVSGTSNTVDYSDAHYGYMSSESKFDFVLEFDLNRYKNLPITDIKLVATSPFSLANLVSSTDTFPIGIYDGSLSSENLTSLKYLGESTVTYNQSLNDYLGLFNGYGDGILSSSGSNGLLHELTLPLERITSIIDSTNSSGIITVILKYIDRFDVGSGVFFVSFSESPYGDVHPTVIITFDNDFSELKPMNVQTEALPYASEINFECQLDTISCENTILYAYTYDENRYAKIPLPVDEINSQDAEYGIDPQSVSMHDTYLYMDFDKLENNVFSYTTSTGQIVTPVQNNSELVSGIIKNAGSLQNLITNIIPVDDSLVVGGWLLGNNSETSTVASIPVIIENIHDLLHLTITSSQVGILRASTLDDVSRETWSFTNPCVIDVWCHYTWNLNSTTFELYVNGISVGIDSNLGFTFDYDDTRSLILNPSGNGTQSILADESIVSFDGLLYYHSFDEILYFPDRECYDTSSTSCSNALLQMFANHGLVSGIVNYSYDPKNNPLLLRSTYYNHMPTVVSLDPNGDHANFTTNFWYHVKIPGISSDNAINCNAGLEGMVDKTDNANSHIYTLQYVDDQCQFVVHHENNLRSDNLGFNEARYNISNVGWTMFTIVGKGISPANVIDQCPEIDVYINATLQSLNSSQCDNDFVTRMNSYNGFPTNTYWYLGNYESTFETDNDLPPSYGNSHDEYTFWNRQLDSYDISELYSHGIDGLTLITDTERVTLVPDLSVGHRYIHYDEFKDCKVALI